MPSIISTLGLTVAILVVETFPGGDHGDDFRQAFELGLLAFGLGDI
jgi:hypothetical protein